jgi:hypothetical protein
MKHAKAAYSFWPIVFIVGGWLWQYVAYRLAFGNTHPEYGFYRRSGGNALRVWLFEIPTGMVALLMFLHAGFVCWRFLREKQRFAAVVYLVLCFVLLAIFVFPGGWMIDIPGRGEFFI